MYKRFDMDRYHRRSIRLPNYDYSQEGAYFITICTWQRECQFGEIFGGEMKLNEYGQVVKDEWMNTINLRPNIGLDEYVIMPNHFHGILFINDRMDTIQCRGVSQYAPTNAFRSPSQTIGAIVRGFKSAATKQINFMRNTQGAPVWQRNYYEHVVRNEKELRSIQEYIINNPLQWDLDENNPVNIK
ncbi:MAG: transposase [Nitrospirae bacterium]|nr:transposase [Nitrospirota bacterium]